MLKAYFDDSNMGQGPHAVLAGWVSNPTVWARFANDWRDVLRMSPRIEYFKWSEFRGRSGQFAGVSKDKSIEVTLLAKLLSEHQPLGIASVISNKLHFDIFGKNPDSIIRGPYFLSLYSAVVHLS
jgi:hypothetical protein